VIKKKELKKRGRKAGSITTRRDKSSKQGKKEKEKRKQKSAGMEKEAENGKRGKNGISKGREGKIERWSGR
jgi:hypothetical protein